MDTMDNVINPSVCQRNGGASGCKAQLCCERREDLCDERLASAVDAITVEVRAAGLLNRDGGEVAEMLDTPYGQQWLTKIARAALSTSRCASCPCG